MEPESGQRESESDTREKLEAEVHACANNTYWERMVINWLDRQAAITERECREYEDALREQRHKRIAELRAERDYYRDMCARDGGGGLMMDEASNAKVLQAYRMAVAAGQDGIADALEDVVLDAMSGGALRDELAFALAELDDCADQADALERELAAVRAGDAAARPAP